MGSHFCAWRVRDASHSRPMNRSPTAWHPPISQAHLKLWTKRNTPSTEPPVSEVPPLACPKKHLVRILLATHEARRDEAHCIIQIHPPAVHLGSVHRAPAVQFGSSRVTEGWPTSILWNIQIDEHMYMMYIKRKRERENIKRTA